MNAVLQCALQRAPYLPPSQRLSAFDVLRYLRGCLVERPDLLPEDLRAIVEAHDPRNPQVHCCVTPDDHRSAILPAMVAIHYGLDPCEPTVAALDTRDIEQLAMSAFDEWCDAEAERHEEAERLARVNTDAAIGALRDLAVDPSRARLLDAMRLLAACDPTETLEQAISELDRCSSRSAEQPSQAAEHWLRSLEATEWRGRFHRQCGRAVGARDESTTHHQSMTGSNDRVTDSVESRSRASGEVDDTSRNDLELGCDGNAMLLDGIPLAYPNGRSRVRAVTIRSSEGRCILALARGEPCPARGKVLSRARTALEHAQHELGIPAAIRVRVTDARNGREPRLTAPLRLHNCLRA